MMLWLLRRLQFEYSQGGFWHIIVGGVEKVFIELIRMVPSIYWRISPWYFRWRCSNEILKYRCSPDPFKIEYVNPDTIKRYTGRVGREHMNRRKLFGSVLNGDFDKSGIRMEESSIYQAAKDHFIHKIPWNKTDAFRHRMKKFERGEYSSSQYKTKEDILDRYRRFDELYERIRVEGYRSQHEILKESGNTNDGLFLDTLDEVTVDVGRNGELLLVDGIHRLAIAKVLELDKIPVVFLVRHKEWMEYREQLCQNNNKIPDHPDLRDLK